MSDKSFRSLRRRRSEETQQAITYQLEHVHEEFGMDILLLADDHGLILAHAGDTEKANLIGVYARSLAEGKALDPSLVEIFPDLKREQVLCESLNLDDIALYLCAVMEPTPENCRAYERVRTGVQRIYYTTSELAGSPEDGDE